MTKLVLIFILTGTLIGCSAYKVDIQQGNVLTKETMSNLKLGMSERQVIALLGTPLVTDPFRENRWDFVYSMTEGNTNEQQYSYVSLLFIEKKLSEIKVHKEPIPEDELKKPGLGLETRFLQIGR